MQIYVVNLANRTDRLAHVTAEFARLGLAFDRVEAVGIDELRRRGLVDLPLPAAAVGCTSSHSEAWRRFVAGGDPWAAVFEDDVLLADAAARFLSSSDWIPPGVDLIKLETFRVPVFLRRRGLDVGDGHAVRELHFRHNGSAAYLISRALARRLAERDPASFPKAIDEFLFDPRMRVFADQRAHQMVPALAIQEMKVDPDGALGTDIERQIRRSGARGGGWLRRVTRGPRHRLAIELRRLRQIAFSRTLDLVWQVVPFGDRRDGTVQPHPTGRK